MVRFSGKVTLAMGQAVGDKEDVTNIKEISWRRMPKPHITPQTVMNTVNPVGWHQDHKWLEIRLKVLSEAYEAFYKNGATEKAYVVEDADNVEIPYFVATLIDHSGSSWIYTFSGVIPEGPDEPYVDGEDTMHVYRLLAKKVVITPPA